MITQITRTRSGTGARVHSVVPNVAERRREILGMITRLDTARRVERPGRAPASRLRQSSAPSTRAMSPNAPDASVAGLALLLQNVEARLARVEERLNRPRSVPAVPYGGPPADATFFGLIKGQMLSDMLQLVTSNRMSGIFVIEGDLSKCSLYFDEGRICHAQNGSMTGEDAFFAAFGAQSGRYHFTESVDLPEERTVSGGTQYLVLEALRRMDESHAT